MNGEQDNARHDALEARTVELDLAAQGGAERRAFLLLDDDGEVSGMVALSAQRHTRVPPQALLVAFGRALEGEPQTEVAPVLTATKRSPLAS